VTVHACGGVLLLVREDGVGAACDGVGGRGGRDVGSGPSTARGFAENSILFVDQHCNCV
jgi:hypothetical protein